MPNAVRNLANNIKSPLYITGGFVRNQIAGLKTTDIDLCGPVLANALMLPPKYIVRIVNYRLGTALIKHERDEFEYTPFRIENYGSGGEHTPTSVSFTSDINKDVLRRDFTCNSLYYDVKNNKLIDLCGGVKDIQNKLLRAKDPEFTFSQDGLRLMRLVRIACQLGFKIDATTASVAKQNAHLLKDISAERKREELEKILIADTYNNIEFAQYRGVKLLHKLGLLQYIIPKLVECEEVEQNPLYHKYNVLEHSFQAVKYADPKVRLSALLHDVGKAYSFKKYGNMHGHDKISENDARDILGQYGLKYSNDEIDKIARLCRHHMYDLDQKTSLSKLKLFVANNIDIIDDLILLKQADAKATGFVREESEYIPNRLIKVKEELLSQNAPMDISELDISGTNLMDIGFRGKIIGELLKEMKDICILEPRLNNYEWLSNFAQKRLVKE